MPDYPRSYERVPIFFPPFPPPLGRAVVTGGSQPPSRFSAPPELALYVNEPFYPPLSTRLYKKALSAKLRTQLDQYRAAKVALQNELRGELTRLREIDPAARMEALAALSRRQAPKIAELEKNAEQLRRDLITGEWTWSALREWHLGDSQQRGFSPIEIAQVMRSFAYYDNTLLPGQRALLREIALELQMAEESTDKAAAAQPYVFFPPEPARVLIPDDAPAEIWSKVAAYQTKKSRLKKDLYDAVYRYDGGRLNFLSSTLKKLAGAQAAPLAELDALAEDIRVGLAKIPEPTHVTERSPLPPVLHARVAALVARIGEAQKEANTAIQPILADNREVPLQVSYRFEADGLRYVVVPSRFSRGGGPSPKSPETLARVEKVRAAFAAIAEEYGRKLAECINEKDAIATETGRLLGTTKADAINNALSAAIRVATAKDTEDSYRDYRIAVFQPGLSPGQRRLLFDAAVERLDLPLPRGELQPMQRGSSW